MEIIEEDDEEIKQLMLRISNKEITLCDSCDTFFDYIPQKISCDECKEKKRREYYQSPEYKARVSEYSREYSRRPEVRAKNRERKRSPEYKAKERERYQSPEHKAKVSKRMREYNQRPEVRAKNRERYQSPEYKAKAREYSRKYYLRKKKLREEE